MNDKKGPALLDKKSTLQSLSKFNSLKNGPLNLCYNKVTNFGVQ
jgi:hypothetical protein